MKLLIAAVFALTSTVSFASLRQTGYEARHIAKIEKAILKQCGPMLGLDLISKFERVVHVDQGIRDVYYVTVLRGVQNNIGYNVKVNSSYADMYDHSEQNWGAYSVQSVDCSSEE
ncbi:hypothetical protein ACJVC5_02015 [Peredibacter sp. HCB2-198]|uniref:hypothetical protein n=1 Tax=Peredibacter sp. HCB2-198 TaxID=3383025 RepID=UPI0038B53ACA